jgi:uncharacterized protein (TIGR00288 family)
MLLVDADNVTVDVIDQAVEQVMARHGAIHVRRAYCTADLAVKHLKLFKTHSIRPIVNISTGKNSTDIALAVDAMDLVVSERPDLVVIVSSDSDFAPLVIRLREKGCRVEGIGQEGKTGEDSKPVYDAFIDLPYRRGKPAPVRAGRPAAPAPGPGNGRRRGGRGGAGARAAEPPARTAEPAPRPRGGEPALRTPAGRPTAPRATDPAPVADLASEWPRVDDGESPLVAPAASALPPEAARKTPSVTTVDLDRSADVAPSEAPARPARKRAPRRAAPVPSADEGLQPSDGPAAPVAAESVEPAPAPPKRARKTTRRAASADASTVDGARTEVESGPAPAVTSALQAGPAAEDAEAAPPPRRRARAPAPSAAPSAALAESAPAASASTPAAPVPTATAPTASAPARGPRPGRASAASPRPPQRAESPPVDPPAEPPTAALPDEVERILRALPELQRGVRIELNTAKERLLQAGLIARSAPTTKLFRKYPTLFALIPEATPNKVQYLRP